MKSCWIVTRDHQAVLEFREVPVPQPKAGEIIVRVHATAMNRGELMVGGVVHGGAEKIGGTEAAVRCLRSACGRSPIRAGSRPWATSIA